MSHPTTKHFANGVDLMVIEAIEGTLSLNPTRLVRLADGWPHKKVILDRARWERARATNDEDSDPLPVAVLCGGGSGHEKAFIGYVGQGMLSAAIAGDLFASPPSSAVLAALRETVSESGAIVVVLSYTGDRLNFGSAIEQFRAESGSDVRMVIVSDDVALRGRCARARKTSARGLAGAMLVLKVAGAAAATGLDLDAVHRLATFVASNVTTMGVALTSCTVPGRAASTRLGPDEMEYGLGAHGEPGAEKSPIEDLDTIVRRVVERVGCIGEFEDDQKVEEGSSVVLLLNSMGATTQLELAAIGGNVRRQVEEILKCKVVRLYSGIFLSSLDMMGFSLSLLRLTDDTAEEVLQHLDAATDADAWPKSSCQPPGPPSVVSALRHLSSRKSFRAPQDGSEVEPDPEMGSVHQAIERACAAAIAARDELNELDSAIGDADCGSTFARGGSSVLESEAIKNATSVHEVLGVIASIAGEAMGGSSGVLLKIFFGAMASELAAGADGDDIQPDPSMAKAVAAGVEKLKFYGGADLGDSTMLDALIPFSDALSRGAVWKDAVDAAREGCEKTRGMTASAGRASYVPEQQQISVADPGATAVVRILEALTSE